MAVAAWKVIISDLTDLSCDLLKPYTLPLPAKEINMFVTLCFPCKKYVCFKTLFDFWKQLIFFGIFILRGPCKIILVEALTVFFLVRASTTTSRGPVTGPRTSNVLTDLKNWKLNLEKLESHLNICNIDLNHWNRVMKNSLLNQPSMFSFFYFLFTSWWTGASGSTYVWLVIV